MQRRSEGSASGGNAYNIRQDKELGQKVIVQKSTQHFPRLPRPFQIFQRKILGRPVRSLPVRVVRSLPVRAYGQIMPTALFGLICLIAGCQPGNKNAFVVSGTYLEVISSSPEAAKIVYNEFKRLDKIFNLYDPGSELYKLNTTFDQPVRVSPELIEVVKLAKDVYELTEGYFDVSKGTLYELWKSLINKRKLKHFPSQEQIDKIKDSGGMEYILIDGDKRMITIKKKGLKIDLSGIAKGFMVDKAVMKLREKGIESALINAGGDLYCLGKKSFRSWKLGIRDPVNKGEIIYPLELSNQGVATSGSYEQFFVYKDKRYSHLIDPFTGLPGETGILSVSVIADNVTIADSLSTAFFIMGIKEINKFFARNKSGLEVFVITGDEKKQEIYVFP